MNNTLQDIVLRQYTDEERIHRIEKEREEVMQDKEFQKWLKEMHIGSRCEVKDIRAMELNMQYDWKKLSKRDMPNFIQNLF